MSKHIYQQVTRGHQSDSVPFTFTHKGPMRCLAKEVDTEETEHSKAVYYRLQGL